MKKCFVCQELKPLSDYYKHSMMSDGHLNKCKDCCKYQAKDRHYELMEDHEWVMKERERGREKANRLYKDIKPTTESKRISMRNYKDNYPEKHEASMAVRKIPISPGFHRHHWSYNREHHTDVITISEKDHALIHRYLIYDRPNKMYKTLNGNLLDTKDKHMKYILWVTSNPF